MLFRSSIAAPAANNSVVRKPGGTSGSGQDTNNNAADFQSQVPSIPHNRSSPPATPPGSLGHVGDTLFLQSVTGGTQLDWANAFGATGYRIYRGTTPGFLGTSPPPWMTSTASLITDTTTSPAPGTAFYYVVHATDGTNESSF